MPFYGQLVVVKRNGADGPVFPFSSRECIIGSGGHCDIRVVSPSVADEHCKLVVNERKEMCLINISPDAPTILNSEPLTAGIPTKLNDGDVFRVAEGVFRYELERQQPRSNVPTRKSTSLVSAGAAISKTPPRRSKGFVKGTPTDGRRSLGQKGSRNTPKLHRRTPQSAAPRLGVAYRDSTNASNKRKSTRKPISKIPTSSSSSIRLLTSSSNVQKSPSFRGFSNRFREAQARPTPKYGGVKKILVQTKEQQSPKLGGVKRMFTRTKEQKTPMLRGVVGLYKEPVERPSPNLGGVKQMFREEALQQSANFDDVPHLFPEVHATENVDRHQPSPSAAEENCNNEVELQTIVENISTLSAPTNTSKDWLRQLGKPYEESKGERLEEESDVSRKRPRSQQCIDNDPKGVPNMAEVHPTPKFGGIKEMLMETKEQQSPKLGGVKRMLTWTKEQNSPMLGGVSSLYMEQKERPSPKLDGIKQMFHEETQQQSPNLDGVSSLFADVNVTRNVRRRRQQKALEEPDDNKMELRSKRRVRDQIAIENVSIASAANTTKSGRRRQRTVSEENEGGLELESEVPSKWARNQKRIDDDPKDVPTLANRRRRQRKPSTEENKGESLVEESEVPSKRLRSRKIQEQPSKKDDQCVPNLVVEAKKTKNVGRRQRKPLEETNKSKPQKHEDKEEVPTARPARSRKRPDYYSYLA